MTEASATPRPGPSTTTAAAVPAASAGVDGSEPVLALPPDTFLSILPGVEDLLELIYGVAEGRDVASDAVVSKAKEVAAQLAAMKSAAASLPGGQLGTDAVIAVTKVLETQAAAKREVLRAFINSPTPVADELARSVKAETEAAGPAPDDGMAEVQVESSNEEAPREAVAEIAEQVPAAPESPMKEPSPSEVLTSAVAPVEQPTIPAEDSAAAETVEQPTVPAGGSAAASPIPAQISM